MTKDELIAALEKATGPDRELDKWIGIVVCGWEPYTHTHHNTDRVTKMIRIPGYGEYSADPLSSKGDYPHFTKSRDTMLPGADVFDWTINGVGSPGPGTWIATAFSEAGGQCIGTAATEPLARRIAEIKALVK